MEAAPENREEDPRSRSGVSIALWLSAGAALYAGGFFLWLTNGWSSGTNPSLIDHALRILFKPAMYALSFIVGLCR